MNREVVLRDWMVQYCNGGRALVGKVYGDSRFADGSTIKTSEIRHTIKYPDGKTEVLTGANNHKYVVYEGDISPYALMDLNGLRV